MSEEMQVAAATEPEMELAKMFVADLTPEITIEGDTMTIKLASMGQVTALAALIVEGQDIMLMPEAEYDNAHKAAAHLIAGIISDKIDAYCAQHGVE